MAYGATECAGILRFSLEGLGVFRDKEDFYALILPLPNRIETQTFLLRCYNLGW